MSDVEGVVRSGRRTPLYGSRGGVGVGGLETFGGAPAGTCLSLSQSEIAGGPERRHAACVSRGELTRDASAVVHRWSEYTTEQSCTASRLAATQSGGARERKFLAQAADIPLAPE